MTKKTEAAEYSLVSTKDMKALLDSVERLYDLMEKMASDFDGKGSRLAKHVVENRDAVRTLAAGLMDTRRELGLKPDPPDPERGQSGPAPLIN